METLRLGDSVRILLGDTALWDRITWIGRRDVITSPRNRGDHTVCVRRDAISDGVPLRDTSLASAHALYIDGMLIPVCLLANGRSIFFSRKYKVMSYWGIGLERHNVVLANGLPVETILPPNQVGFIDAYPSQTEQSEEPGEDHRVIPFSREVRPAL